VSQGAANFIIRGLTSAMEKYEGGGSDPSKKWGAIGEKKELGKGFA